MDWGQTQTVRAYVEALVPKVGYVLQALPDPPSLLEAIAKEFRLGYDPRAAVARLQHLFDALWHTFKREETAPDPFDLPKPVRRTASSRLCTSSDEITGRHIAGFLALGGEVIKNAWEQHCPNDPGIKQWRTPIHAQFKLDGFLLEGFAWCVAIVAAPPEAKELNPVAAGWSRSKFLGELNDEYAADLREEALLKTEKLGEFVPGSMGDMISSQGALNSIGLDWRRLAAKHKDEARFHADQVQADLQADVDAINAKCAAYMQKCLDRGNTEVHVNHPVLLPTIGADHTMTVSAVPEVPPGPTGTEWGTATSPPAVDAPEPLNARDFHDTLVAAGIDIGAPHGKANDYSDLKTLNDELCREYDLTKLVPVPREKRIASRRYKPGERVAFMWGVNRMTGCVVSFDGKFGGGAPGDTFYTVDAPGVGGKINVRLSDIIEVVPEDA